jgi:hypothetical protein
VDLEQAPAYGAISYAWGDATDTRETSCGTGALKITISLFEGLRRFTGSATTRVLWADAMCIDQSNALERGHQVNFMNSIYSCARTVLVWLSEDTLNIAEESMKLNAELNESLEERFLQTNSSKEPWERIQQISKLPRETSLFDKSRWEALMRFLDSPWFSRLWVLQEVGLASSAVSFCGSFSQAFSEIVQVALF